MKLRSWEIVLAIAVIALLVPQDVYGMHIAEGFLAPQWCLLWYAVTLPFLAAGIYTIRKQTAANHKIKILLGVAGAFTFLLSALKLPSVTGSCSHMTGTGLGAILFGPATMSVLGLIVLLFQALLLAHGGITTLGANTFSMGIAGPFLSWGIYMLLSRLRIPQSITVFAATFAGSLFTYCVTAFQLALAFPGANGSVAVSFVKFGTVFGFTQLPLSVIEGLVSVMVFHFIQSHNHDELLALDVYGRAKP
jgi:cobalt/nickel transport system permease protein